VGSVRRVTTVVVGAGHAGLAMSRCLAERSIDHVVLERGRVANSWRTERWDSLRLLTPNWQSRLPGFGYEGDDPDGYRTMPETVAFIDAYAEAISAPVETQTRVISVKADGDGYRVATDRGDWRCRSVVLATGACNVASVPKIAEACSACSS
jgi:putative flavoprotein involved in K+ transport